MKCACRCCNLNFYYVEHYEETSCTKQNDEEKKMKIKHKQTSKQERSKYHYYYSRIEHTNLSLDEFWLNCFFFFLAAGWVWWAQEECNETIVIVYRICVSAWIRMRKSKKTKTPKKIKMETSYDRFSLWISYNMNRFTQIHTHTHLKLNDLSLF